ncbi:MAG: heme o synthase [Bryobacterales bacterium]|nr:heme o synthase [Bryobacterales bacterium]
MRDYIALTKPRITWLILMSTGIGYFFGVDGGWQWITLLHTIAGTGLIASGTAALNQWMERDADAHMKRTRNRPLVTGVVRPAGAFVFAVALSVAGYLELALGANWLAANLGLLTLATYLFLYTPLKQKTWWATTIGAFPGAMPPLIGFAAAHGGLNAQAWALYSILFLWQFPHFYAIAWMYREDYARAGMQMLPVVDPEGVRTARHILVTSALLLPISLVPSFLSMTGVLYLAGATVLGFIYAWAGVRVARERTVFRARKVLLASVAYLPLLYLLMIVDRPGL